MDTRLTWKDWAWTGVLLLCLLVLTPLGLWGYSKYRENAFKSDVNAIVPGVMRDAESTLQRAADLVAAEVTSSRPINNIYRGSAARAAIDQACQDVRESILRQNPDLRANDNFCDLYIKRDGSYIRADKYTIIGTSYPYDLQDFTDLLSTNEQWRLYPNGRNWRVKYKLRTEPLIIFDFEVGSKDADYGY